MTSDMKSVMPKKYNFLDTETKYQDLWSKHQIYKWNSEDTNSPKYVIDTPPPTVSGKLHIGHIFSYTHTDFIARFKRMTNHNVFYPIGFDDNGLPTERLVEKKEKIKAASLSREEFTKICQKIVAEEEEIFRKLFKSTALSVDWNHEYQTISAESCKLSQMSFLDLLKKNEVYRSEQPMLWDAVDQTALAQAEIEEKEQTTIMNDINFDIDTNDNHNNDIDQKITIATTRPELLAACVSVFYHPEDSRYTHLEGKFAITPLFNIKVPILADENVKMDKGTGLVMCCSFGDQLDMHWIKTHKLKFNVILDKYAKLKDVEFDDKCQNKEQAKHFYEQIKGLKVKAAREKIIELLKEYKYLIKQEEKKQFVKCAERSGAPLEILTTPQWFVKTVKHKQILLQRSNEINWYPQNMKIKLDSWINNVNMDWCISRQRYFGVPFPVWYSTKAGEEGKIILPDIDQLPVNPIIDLPKGYTKDEVVPDYDVMDTWATSAISPQLSSKAINDEFYIDIEKHKKIFPFDLRPQAHEILRTWAFDTILKSHLHENTLPWKNIMISGWCLASDKSKMSKSKGNIIEPQKLLTQYGSDVIRYWAANAKLGADTVYNEDIMKNGKRLVNKIFNSAKFVSQHFQDIKQEDSVFSQKLFDEKIICIMDQYAFIRLNNLIKDVTDLLNNYNYAVALEKIELFFFGFFCDDYLEIIKTRAYNDTLNLNHILSYSAKLTLYHCFDILMKLFAPFIPHITEEIYQLFYTNEDSNISNNGDDFDSIHTKGAWPKYHQFLIDTDNDQIKKSIEQSERLIEILNLVRKFKAGKNLSIKTPIENISIIQQNEENVNFLTQDLTIDLKNVTSTSMISYINKNIVTEQQSIIQSEKEDIAILIDILDKKK